MLHVLHYGARLAEERRMKKMNNFLTYSGFRLVTLEGFISTLTATRLGQPI